MNEGFENSWRERFREFAELREDDAGIAGWSPSGLAVRFRRFRTLWGERRAEGVWLDAGCGAATYARFLAEAGACVVGADYSIPSLVKASARDTRRIAFIAADVRRLPLSAGSMHGALCFGVTQALSGSTTAVAELIRVLAPGAELWIDGLNRYCAPNAIARWRRRIQSKPAHLRYEGPWALQSTLRDAGFVNTKLHWMPILPRGLQRLQPWIERRWVCHLLTQLPPLAAVVSHAFIVTGQRPPVGAQSTLYTEFDSPAAVRAADCATKSRVSMSHSVRWTGSKLSSIVATIVASAGLALLLGSDLARGQVGNRDYYNPGTDGNDTALFANVHSYHLQPAFDALARGNLKGAHDHFEFILNAYPNSPQALNGMSELCTTKWKSPACDADAWFEKAAARNPSASMTWVIYGLHLQRKGQLREAIEKFEHALELRPNDINAHYNLGLLYFDLKDYEKANRHAQMSYALGAPLPGLRDKLMRAKAWSPLPPSSPESPSNASPKAEAAPALVH